MKEIIENLRLLSAEVAARTGSPFWRYRPHAKQEGFHRCAAKCRFVFGGNRTGKSECGAVETVWRATGTHPYALAGPVGMPFDSGLPLGAFTQDTQDPACGGQGTWSCCKTPKRPPLFNESRGLDVEGRKRSRSSPLQTEIFVAGRGGQGGEGTPNPLGAGTPIEPAANVRGGGRQGQTGEWAGGDCWVVSLTRQVQRDVVQQKILKYLPKPWIVQIVMTEGSAAAAEYGVIDFIIVKNRAGGVSKIGFRNCEQGRERFQGVGLDFIWFDEEPPEDIYDECLLRLLDRGGVHFATMTPLKGRSWVFDRIYLAGVPMGGAGAMSGVSVPAGVSAENGAGGGGETIAAAGALDARPRLFSMSWADNPHLNPAEIADMEGSLPPAVLESRKFGRFVDNAGLVYPEFTDENIAEPFSAADIREKFIVIDTGWTDPTAVLWACRDHMGNVYIVRDYEVARQTAETHSNEIKRGTAELGWDLGDVKVLMDSAANQRTAGSPVSAAEQYRACGINADTGVCKFIFPGVMAVRAAFCDLTGARKLFVFRSCVNLIRELRGYFWGDGDKPQGGRDHTLDCLRYLIMHIQNQTEKPAAGILGAAKQEFIKKIRRGGGG